MKIIQFTPFFPPHKGGLEVVAQNISKYLVSGHSTKVINITSSIGQDIDNKDKISYGRSVIGYQQDGYEVICIPSFEIVHNFPVPKIRNRKFRTIVHYIKTQNADIIQTHTRFFLQTFLGMILGKCFNIPIVHVEHGSGYVTGITKRKEKIARLYDQSLGRLSFILADKVVSINEKNKEFITHFVKKEKCQTIYNGIERSLHTKKRESDHNELRIVFIGRLIRLKGVKFLLEAAKLLIEKGTENFHLDIIGDGDERYDLEHLARRLRLQQYVNFLGAKNHDEIVNEILPNTDILVNPSLQEGLPTTVLEGLLAECVVVATDVGGTREISDQKDLVLVEAGNSKRLAEKLEYAIENYKELQGLSESHIKEKFNWEKAAEKYENIYKTLI